MGVVRQHKVPMTKPFPAVDWSPEPALMLFKVLIMSEDMIKIRGFKVSAGVMFKPHEVVVYSEFRTAKR